MKKNCAVVKFFLNSGGGTPGFVDASSLLPDAPPGVANFGTDAEMFDVDFDGDLDIVVGLGTLGTATAPFVLPGVPNSSLGIEVLVNPGTPGVPFTRVFIANASGFDTSLSTSSAVWRKSLEVAMWM